MRMRAKFLALLATAGAFSIDDKGSSNALKLTSSNLTAREDENDVSFEPVEEWKGGPETGGVQYRAYLSSPKTYVVRRICAYFFRKRILAELVTETKARGSS